MRWFPLRKSCAAELNLYHTLLNGQCFNWRLVSSGTGSGLFEGVLQGHVFRLRHDANRDRTMYSCASLSDADISGHEAAQSLLEGYFQLNGAPLRSLYDEWGQGCSRMQAICAALPGMRVVRQDPFECLISFICSSNNNIPRIKQMLQKLRVHYGTRIRLKEKIPPAGEKMENNEDGDGDQGEVDAKVEIEFYAFPDLKQLGVATEKELRNLGFGYRAKFIVRTVAQLKEKEDWWLHRLREESEASEVRSKLMELHGVGRKVADCVALFSLDQRGVVPVDTHVWQIACRYYDDSLVCNANLNDKLYQKVNEVFIRRFGHCAGWAHCLLFAAELPEYRKLLPGHILKEQEEQIQAEKLAKAQAKAAKKEKKEVLSKKSTSRNRGNARTKRMSRSRSGSKSTSTSKKPMLRKRSK